MLFTLIFHDEEDGYCAIHNDTDGFYTTGCEAIAEVQRASHLSLADVGRALTWLGEHPLMRITEVSVQPVA